MYFTLVRAASFTTHSCSIGCTCSRRQRSRSCTCRISPALRLPAHVTVVDSLGCKTGDWEGEIGGLAGKLPNKGLHTDEEAEELQEV